MVCFRRNDLLGKAELVDAGNKTAEVRKKAFFFWTGPVPDPSAGCPEPVLAGLRCDKTVR